jgi:hypothetical protein
MTSPDGTWLPPRPKSSLQMREQGVQKRPIQGRLKATVTASNLAPHN